MLLATLKSDGEKVHTSCFETEAMLRMAKVWRKKKHVSSFY
jgi:hypothetical protein